MYLYFLESNSETSPSTLTSIKQRSLRYLHKQISADQDAHFHLKAERTGS